MGRAEERTANHEKADDSREIYQIQWEPRHILISFIHF